MPGTIVGTPEYNADTLIRIARLRMKEAEDELAALAIQQQRLVAEHGKLYAIVKAHDDGNLIREEDVSSDTPSVTIGSHTIKVGRDF
jgi:hypothetical protein